MAEATQSLSLEDDHAHDADDQLWLGHAKIPRNIACCEITVNLPSFSPSSSTLNGERDSVFVVNDLTKNPQTLDRPFVTGFPDGRFYAGVPVTAASGINIGAYCILDDAPRSGVSDKDLMFLRDMSRTIMTHLETVRAQAERERATHMVTGLGAFVKSSSDSRRWKRRNPAAPPKRSASASTRAQRTGLVNRGSYRSIRSSVPAALIDDAAATKTHIAGVSHLGNPDQNRPRTQENTVRSTEQNDTNMPEMPFTQSAGRINSQTGVLNVSETQSSRLDNLPKQTPSSDARPQLRKWPSVMNVRSIYQRASEIMCESLSVDGVAFADASVHTFGGLAETVDSAGATDASTCDESETSSIKSRPDSPTFYIKGKVSQVLGCAESVQDESAEVTGGQPATRLTDSFLRQLLRRHPHGKIWSFSALGQAHSEDTSSSSGNDDLQEAGTPNKRLSAGAEQRKRRQAEARRDAEILASMFPGARTVAIHGIRDASRRRWTAGCILWSYDPLRVLTMDTELNLVAAFCDIIAGETRRLEIQRSDKSKSDFISSISHELRSPLHGILGSTEVLKDLDLNSMASTLAGQIDSCGRTLLDIIDHLLDFATLKGQKIERGAASSAKIRRSMSFKGSKTSAEDDLADVDTSVSLDDLTEEAVESTVYSFNCKKGIDYEPRTSVILDIDRSPSYQWDCQLATGGWRRICINLITNALKYTPTGFIRVSLAQRPRPGSKRQFEAIFTVTDSGKGMSKDFLDNHLFRDFSQEDTLADGIGLGMHMVGRIVHAIGAKIDVVSEQNGPGAGTTVTVTVPLEHSQARRKNSLATEAMEKSTQVALAGLKARIVSNRSPNSPGTTREERLVSTASAMATTSLEKSCEALGLLLVERHSADRDLNVIFENDFEYFVRAQDNDNNHSRLSNKPCIVICNSNAAGKTVKASRDKEVIRLNAAVEYIAMPCGVKTITRAITSALVRQKELDATTPRPIDDSKLQTIPKPERVELGEVEVPPVNPITSPQEVPVRPAIRSSKSFQGSGRLRANSKLQESLVSGPVAQPHEQGPASKQQTDSVSIPSTSPPKNAAPMLLLVDDNKVNLQLLTMYAKKQGYPYISATDGQMAVDAYQKAHEDSHLPDNRSAAAYDSRVPDIILMDINMPIMDGYEATQHIRTYEKKHSLPAATIIALTALGSEAAYQEAFGSGCDMFLTKPVKLKDLTKIIEEM
ncbi:hypothetical protein MBLNU13_g06700t2 [Cladosporium sp. NU13]